MGGMMPVWPAGRVSRTLRGAGRREGRTRYGFVDPGPAGTTASEAFATNGTQ
jgi:hypothetical protein